MKKYDYIFIGMGCAGLSLLTRMIAAGLTRQKSILLIDRAPKEKNDRTWCFWENKQGFFEPVVAMRWGSLWFHAESFSKNFDIEPYQYKMIRGIDFYRYCFQQIDRQINIDRLYGEITDLNAAGNNLQLSIDGRPCIFTGAVIFNSTWQETVVRQQPNIYLLQHFKGWVIETEKPSFNPGEAVLMDFRVSQQHGTTFVYVLPLSERRALVEYTLFSASLLPPNLYNEGLQQYLSHFLQLKDYTVTDEEFGVIPMTSAAFPWFHNGMYHIGTAGGQTKASSGYTFQFIQKQSEAIIRQLQNNTLSAHTNPLPVSSKFIFYDAVLLQVLANQYAAGSRVFTQLFKNNPSHSIFQFLDNESSLRTDLRIITSLPLLPFLKAACKQLLQG